MDNFSSTLTVAEASSLLGLSSRQTTRLAVKGEISIVFKADGLRGIYLLDKASVEALAAQRGNK